MDRSQNLMIALAYLGGIIHIGCIVIFFWRTRMQSRMRTQNSRLRTPPLAVCQCICERTCRDADDGQIVTLIVLVAACAHVSVKPITSCLPTHLAIISGLCRVDFLRFIGTHRDGALIIVVISAVSA